MDTRKYIQVLEIYFKPFKEQLFSGPIGFTYHHDGSALHRAKSVSAFLDVENVEVLL